MIAISLRADAMRSVAAVLTATGQYASMPVRALGLRILADGIVVHDGSRALRGTLFIVALSGVNRLMAWWSLNVRMRLRENTQLYLDAHLMDLTAGIPGLAHHELPAYLDRVELIRNERWYLANPFNPISWTFASIVGTLSVIVLLGGVRPALALLPLFGLPAAIASGRAEKARVGLLDTQAEDHRVLRHLKELAVEPGPAKEVRIFGLADELVDRHRRLFARLEATRVRLAARNLTVVVLGWVLFAVAYAAAVVWTVRLAGRGQVTAGAVVLVLSLGAQINAQLAELAWNVEWFVRTHRAVGRLVWFSEYAASARAAVTPARPLGVPDRLQEGIRFRDVEFAYPGTDRAVLAGVDLLLPAGTTVAMVGENGAGKTTLVKLLARFYSPTAGVILVDGVDLRDFPVEEWRARIAAGFQDFARFELVARESVGVGHVPHLDSEPHVAAALSRAVAAELPDSWPEGLATQLGREFAGVELSVGQWQKVALGRAMMRATLLLLVLDEPTASLDAPTEHALFERFAGAAREVAATTGGITILVSHRFSTVRMADLILVMGGGRIVESGSHEELMDADGVYAQLYRLQAKAYR